jgi:hypothetical protein
MQARLSLFSRKFFSDNLHLTADKRNCHSVSPMASESPQREPLGPGVGCMGPLIAAGPFSLGSEDIHLIGIS